MGLKQKMLQIKVVEKDETCAILYCIYWNAGFVVFSLN